MSFRVEYKRNSTGPVMFQRQVRFQVELSEITKQSSEALFAITFTLLNGNIRRFRRICEHIQSQVCSKNAILHLGTSCKGTSSSPRTSRKHSLDMSESSSCGSDTSDRLFVASQSVTKQINSALEPEHSIPEIQSTENENKNTCSTSTTECSSSNSTGNRDCQNAINNKFIKTKSGNNIA